MILFISLFFVSLIAPISYIFFLKPYITAKKLKKQFQAKGYKVLVRQLNFMKQIVTPRFKLNTKNHNDCFYAMKDQYQNYDICIQNSFNKLFVTLINIQLIKQTYKKFEFFEKNKLLANNFSRINGGGLLFSQGNQWKNKRKVYSQIFNFKLLQELHPHIENATKQTINKWKMDQQVDMLYYLRELFFNIFVSSYFGRQFTEFKYKDMTYSYAIVHLFDIMFNQSYKWRNILLGHKFLEKGYTKVDKEIQQLLIAIKSQTKTFIEKRLQEILSQNASENSILSKIVFNENFKNLSDQEKNVKIEEIVGDVMIFFFAGTDTTSAAMMATLHLLHKNPQILQKVMQEIDNSPQDYLPSTIKGLKYMDAVFNEVLRLYGPANALFTRIPKDNTLTLGDVSIPKGLILLIQNYTNQSSQKYYENALQFKPQRWLTKQIQTPFAYLPFSSGPRNCIGQHLSRSQYKIALSMILRKFSFKTKDSMSFERPIIYISANNKFLLRNRK